MVTGPILYDFHRPNTHTMASAGARTYNWALGRNPETPYGNSVGLGERSEGAGEDPRSQVGFCVTLIFSARQHIAYYA